MGFFSTCVWLTVSLFFTILTIKIYEHLDFNKVAPQLRPGKCRYVDPIVNGSEDVTLFENHAFITSGLRYTKSKELDGTMGQLYYMDMGKINNETPKAQQLKILWGDEKARDFNPHGLKVLKTSSGALHLYVINHESKGDAVEIFEVNLEKLTATPVKTIRSKNIYNGNNLAVLGPEEFYLSNDVYFKNSLLKTMEFIVPILKLGAIAYHNGKEQKDSLVQQFQHMPNGVGIDVKKKHLFVASILTRSLWVYKIQENKSLKKIKEIHLGTLPDNVFYDDELHGVWIGCHPVAYQLIKGIEHPKTEKAPSQVIFVQFTEKDRFDKYTIHEKFSDSGDALKASTVAVRYQNRLLIGTVYDRLMMCDIEI